MVIDVTYACKMGCTHCMSDCKPDGMNMSIEIFKDSLKFLRKYNIPTWHFSGGEFFEHPDVLEMIDILSEEMKTMKWPITISTNGRELVRNKEIYDKVNNLIKKHGKRRVMLQITDDDRFYPDSLTNKEKYWLGKIVTIMEPVPGAPGNKDKCLYPQGRAIENFPDSDWYTNGPKCINVRLMVAQGITSINGIVMHLFAAGKFCTPTISPDGFIKLGESALCPPVASIYDDEKTIISKIKNSDCRQCKIAWEILERNLK